MAALGFRASASSTTITRAGASCGRVRASATMTLASSTTICPPGPDGAERRHVGVEARLDAAADLAGAAAGAGRRRAVERHRQPERGAPLADAGRPLEQVGVRDAAAARARAEQGRPRQLLADEVRRAARPEPSMRTAPCRATLTLAGTVTCRMGILGRLSTLIKSNVNDAIDSMQDPGKEIDQMVRDMEDYARQARAEVGRCIADERRARAAGADARG